MVYCGSDFAFAGAVQPTVTAEGTHGWVRIQREEDPKQVQKRFATVKTSYFTTYNTEKVKETHLLLLHASDSPFGGQVFAATEKWVVDLRGCTAELVQKPKNAIKLYRK